MIWGIGGGLYLIDTVRVVISAWSWTYLVTSILWRLFEAVRACGETLEDAWELIRGWPWGPQWA